MNLCDTSPGKIRKKAHPFRSRKSRNKNAAGETDIQHTRSTSRSVPKRKGSLTVEAALALPLFLSAMLLFAQLYEGMLTCFQADHYLVQTARRAAAQTVSADGISYSEAAGLFYGFMNDSCMDMGGISGGRAGVILDLQDEEKTMFALSMDFDEKAKGFLLPAQQTGIEDTVYARAWTGDPLEGSGSDGQTEGEMVYVAENGVVYHKSADCTYIHLSVHAVSAWEAGSLTNDYGEKYRACSLCGSGEMSGTLYVTDTGEAWHTDPDCSGLKRTLRLMSAEDAVGLGLRECSRCGG